MKKYFEYVIVFFLVLSCNSIYYVSTKNYYINYILIFLLVIMFLFYIVSKDFNKKKIVSTICFLFFYYMYIILFMLLNDMKDYENFIYTFGISLPLLYFVYNTSKEKEIMISILEKIPNVMFVLSIISLLFYLFGSISNIILPNNVITINWGTERYVDSYYGLHFNTQSINIFGKSIIRNTGIFPEAPMFSLNLVIALGIELFICKKKYRLVKNVLLITIFTTTSTIGIIISSVMIIMSIVLKKQKRDITKMLKFLILPFIIVVLGIISLFFFSERKETTSYSDRLDDYNACYLAWKDNILLGNGYGDNTPIQMYMSSFRMHNTGLSNSIMVVLAQGGIYLFLLYLIPTIRAIVYALLNKKKNVLMFVTTIIALFVLTIFQYKIILINFLAIGFMLPMKK